MSRYAKTVSTKVTSQSEPIPGSDQVANSAGGFAFQVDDWTLLDRFLILGTESGSYYAGEKEMTLKATDAIRRCIKVDGIHVVNRVFEISKAGRAPKNDPAIFVLALAAKTGNSVTRATALANMRHVCRTSTHMFQFAAALEQFGGWGRGTKRAFGTWYSTKRVDQVAYQVIKYRQRDGWTHKDILRLAKPNWLGSQNLYRWIVGKPVEGELPALITAFQLMEAAKTAGDVIKIIGEYPELPWETIPSQFLKDPGVWEALLPSMPMTALIRNLARMTVNGTLTWTSAATNLAVQKLTDAEQITRQRVHPISALIALKTYAAGRSVRGDSTWTPVTKIIDALDTTFYKAFSTVEPTGKRVMLTLDLSNSMGRGDVGGAPGLTPRIAAAAMSMVTAAVEKDYLITGFTARGKDPVEFAGRSREGLSLGISTLDISPRQRLDDVVRSIERYLQDQKGSYGFTGTDCSLPMQYALERNIQVDAFIVYTDSETWAGKIHPSQALRQYREKTGIPAKLIVVGMVASQFSIADPNDAGMFNCVGFDTATPNLMSDFIRGE